MPIEVAIWKINNDKLNKVDYSVIESEKKLEELINKDISVISDDLFVVGTQVRTEYGKYIDILAVNSEGKITIIELRKAKTPRDVVAQSIDYASWVQNLSYAEILAIYKENNEGKEFEVEFSNKFDIDPPEELNTEHDIMIVCTELDYETERIINYLSENFNVPLNAVFFRYFSNGNEKFLSRSWLIDPNTVEEKASKVKSKQELWNGNDFVVNIDSFDGISCWEDCRKYNYICAGGGKWYSRTLNQLKKGHRIFAMIPKHGYVGVGEVVGEYVPIKDFSVIHNNKEQSIIDVHLKVDGVKSFPHDDLDKCEYFVKVKWLKIVDEKDAYWEKGMRANQNSAFKFRSKFTLTKLLDFFNLEN